MTKNTGTNKTPVHVAKHANTKSGPSAGHQAVTHNNVRAAGGNASPRMARLGSNQQMLSSPWSSKSSHTAKRK